MHALVVCDNSTRPKNYSKVRLAIIKRATLESGLHLLQGQVTDMIASGSRSTDQDGTTGLATTMNTALSPQNNNSNITRRDVH